MRRLAGALLALAALTPACAQRGVALVPGSELPADVYDAPPPDPTASIAPEFPGRSGRIFLVREGRLAAVRRRHLPPAPSLTEALLQSLLNGPRGTEAETEIPPGTSLLEVAVAGGVATVDLSTEFEAGAPGPSLALRAAQVVYTLFEDPKIRAVLFRVEGEATGVVGGDQRVHRGLVTTQHYARFAPTPP